MEKSRSDRWRWLGLLMALVALTMIPAARLAAEPDDLQPAAYLPLVSSPANLLPNGGFELGRVIWQQEAKGLGADSTVLIATRKDSTLPVLFYPYRGDWVGYLGGDTDDLDASLWQTVTVPDGESHLYFWYWIDSLKDCPGEDYLSVQIEGQEVRRFELCKGNNTNGWQRSSPAVDLSSIEGVDVEVRFRVHIVGVAVGSLEVSVFLLDNVGWSDGP
ncbi:MAG: hypothetical protein R3300_03625 [Candidatus Promineifilaceae bacterium]|nr:hypothetical protein [Candidatus Promineifilaceae bacterium]